MGGREDAVQRDGLCHGIHGALAKYLKKWVMSSRSEGFSSGAECYVLQMADMWEMFADQAWLEFGKIQVVAKEKTTHQDALIDQSTGSEESGNDLPDDLTLS